MQQRHTGDIHTELYTFQDWYWMKVIISFIPWMPLPSYQLKADPSTVQELTV
jgi:hypothetical protein